MSLIQDWNFRRFWLAQGCSLIGAQVALLALPLIAINFFHASSFQIGLLASSAYLPFLLFGLAAGVWVDRLNLKRVLVICDFARFALLATVPLLFLAGLLSLPVLYAITFMTGFFTLIFDVGDQSFLPQITETAEDIVDGNTKLYLTFSLSQLVGPTVGGALIEAATAPVAVIAGCLSYFVSWALLMGIKITNVKSTKVDKKPLITAEMKAGIQFVIGDGYLRPLVICMAIANFFDIYGIIQAVLVLFITRDLGMSVLQLSCVLVISNLGAIIGTLVNNKVVDQFGVGNTILVSSFIPGAALLFLPMATARLGILSVGLPLCVANFGVALFNVNQLSLRQQITPIGMLGRMNATIRFLIWGTIPLGTFCGGLFGDGIGLRRTLLIAAAGSLCAGLPILLSKIGRLKSLPARRTEIGIGQA